MRRYFRLLLKAPLTYFLFFGVANGTSAANGAHPSYSVDTLARDTVKTRMQEEKKDRGISSNDTLFIQDVKKSPYISLQQYLKGNVAGLYVQENNGEPGTIQNMLIRGLSRPLFSNRDLPAAQPTVYLNGLPLIQHHPFNYDIKLYDINPPGTGSNLLAGLDLSNVVSIEVIKDPAQLAKLGPLAANGAIWITTNDATDASGKNRITLNASYGMVTPPASVRPTNASYERDFRKQFYDAHGLPFGDQQLPGWSQDASDLNYYGNASWADSYYNMAQQYNADASISGGGDFASFLFKAGSTKNAGIADQTGYSKNNISFFANMRPIPNLQMKAMIYGATANRKRNKNLRDRYAETEYYADFSTPIAPAGNAYERYLTLYDETVDENTTNYINGYLKLEYLKNKIAFGADLLFDYNIDTRHVFWPSTLMESVSFISDYSGFNRRAVVKAYGGYRFDINQVHLFDLRIDGGYYADLHRYNYTKAYDGSNDKHKTTTSGSYRTYNYLNEERAALLTSSFQVGYRYQDLLSFSAVLRYDGYSNVQPDSRWLFSPAFSGNWNLKNQLLEQSDVVSDLSLGVSWARIGKLLGYSRFSVGPNYTSENLSWEGQPVISSYNLFATFSRPYAYGWSAYDIGWPYADKLSVDLAGSFFKKRLDVSVSLYSNDDKNMIVPATVPQEYGYRYQYLAGMHVNNLGADVTVSGAILSNPKGLGWISSLNMNYNRNELRELPGGRSELILGERKLQVGHAIDQFWVFENEGIYSSDESVPQTDGAPLSITRIPFREGDPRWTDVNRDNQIDLQDKVLKGHALPKVTGGLNNHFTYKRFDLNFHLFFALGHDALNVRDARRYDFTTLDGQNSLAALKEIHFWQNTNQRNDYPIYNPLSELHPYRQDQDLFMEDLSYLKLRSVSIGYQFDRIRMHGLYVYLVANNIWTLTSFSGGDPELVGFNGYFTGYSQPIPFSMAMGLRLKF